MHMVSLISKLKLSWSCAHLKLATQYCKIVTNFAGMLYLSMVILEAIFSASWQSETLSAEAFHSSASF